MDAAGVLASARVAVEIVGDHRGPLMDDAATKVESLLDAAIALRPADPVLTRISRGTQTLWRGKSSLRGTGAWTIIQQVENAVNGVGLVERVRRLRVLLTKMSVVPEQAREAVLSLAGAVEGERPGALKLPRGVFATSTMSGISNASRATLDEVLAEMETVLRLDPSAETGDGEP